MAKKTNKAEGYKPETIVKFIRMGKEKISEYMEKSVSEIPQCISKGNEKIGKVMNVSLLPIFTCKNCKECKKFCYDIKANFVYGNVLDARVRNYVLLKKDRDEFFKRIDNAMNRRRTNKLFRWHVAGDIVDLDYFVRMVENAKRHPDFKIWTYTKNYDIVNEYCNKYGKDSIPNNFKIMFSEWRGLPMNNPYHFPVFHCKFPDDSPLIYEKMYKCPGNCDVCKMCDRGCIRGEDVYTDLH